MTPKVYNILLDGTQIGTTLLEAHDAPMGVVFGEIKFDAITSGYDFFKAYCQQHNLHLLADNATDRLLSTPHLPGLRVISPTGVEIAGTSLSVSGMDADVFTLDIAGVEYPFYEEEFPHHVAAYNKQFE
ncbi:MAG TPA: hypothetical protein VK174_14270 [Chitinophagales bacterium]|nr:hypothetical protein [Chitinophagales bacterium]